MNKILTAMILAVLVFSVAAVDEARAETETKDVQGIYEECGIGGLLFPSWPVGASVSNVIWDLGTTAATSGLTTPDACKGGEAKLAAYIFEAYDSLEMDLARGDGKYLDMLTFLSEKTADEKAAFILAVRDNFRSLVAQEDYSSLSRLEKAKRVYTIVRSQA